MTDSRWVERNAESCSRNYRFPSIIISEADGIYLKDEKGHSYMDFTSGGHTANLGHKHPEVMAAVNRQLARTGLSSLGWVLNDQRVELAEALKRIAPGRLVTGKVGFCNTGSQATELTLRLAQQYSKRQFAVCTFGCFHGQTSMGALALNTSPDGRRYGVPNVPGVFYVPYPYCYRCLFGADPSNCGLECLEFVRYQLETEVIPGHGVAVFFIEPFQVHGGMIPLPDGYLAALRQICDDYGILLAADEVVTGLGRTGKWFGVQNWDVDVDIVYLAKPLASGLSLGAIIGAADLMSHFRGGGTFSGNPVACAAAVATIRVIEGNSLLDNCRDVGSYLMRRLHEISDSLSLVGDIRGLGLLVGIELVEDRFGKEPATRETQRVIQALAKKGLLMFDAGVYHNVLRLCPPLIITPENVDSAVDILEHVLKEESRTLTG